MRWKCLRTVNNIPFINMKYHFWIFCLYYHCTIPLQISENFDSPHELSHWKPVKLNVMLLGIFSHYIWALCYLKADVLVIVVDWVLCMRKYKRIFNNNSLVFLTPTKLQHCCDWQWHGLQRNRSILCWLNYEEIFCTTGRCLLVRSLCWDIYFVQRILT